MYQQGLSPTSSWNLSERLAMHCLINYHCFTKHETQRAKHGRAKSRGAAVGFRSTEGAWNTIQVRWRSV